MTLMHLKEPPDERKAQMLAPVRYAVERKIARGKPDYWDWATLLELAVLGNDEAEILTRVFERTGFVTPRCPFVARRRTKRECCHNQTRSGPPSMRRLGQLNTL
jgi:hypothetical protein